MSIAIRFWGVRGSVPSPGPETAGVGGNTSCVEVRCGDHTLVLDAGTGLRALGEDLIRRGRTDVHLLFSHVHWDHIQGLPFFGPLYRAEASLDLYGAGTSDQSLREILASQMQSPTFPVGLRDAAARLSFHPLDASAPTRIGPVTVTCAPLNHPNGCLALRLDCAGRAIVYATDTEHVDGAGPDPALVALARECDLLIYDAQYTPEEYAGKDGPSRVGWGHSTWQAGVAVARAAAVKRLVLFHHDPSHSDERVAAIEALAAAHLPGTVAAREGFTIQLESKPNRAAA